MSQPIYHTDFEDGFYAHNDIPEVQVPNGWIPDWSQDTGVSGPMVRPEFKPETDADHIYDGHTSAKLTHRFATFDGVLYVQLPVDVGAQVYACAHVQLLTERPEHDDPRGGLQAQVGIDPYGGTDFLMTEVAWGDWWGQYQDDWTATKWAELETSAQAEGDTVTIYLRAKVDYAVNVAAAFWDAVSVSVETDSPPPPEDPGQEKSTDLTAIADALEQHAAQLRLIDASATQAHTRIQDALATLIREHSVA